MSIRIQGHDSAEGSGRTKLALLASVIALACVLTAAYAAVGASDDSDAAVTEGSCGTAVTFVFDDAGGILSISGSGEMANYTSTSRAPWYSSAADVKSVVIGDGITSIGTQAFMECTNLTGVTIGNDIEEIGVSAFQGCSKLASVVIPDSTVTVGDFAFSGCTGLKTVTFGAQVKTVNLNTSFQNCFAIQEITFRADDIQKDGVNIGLGTDDRAFGPLLVKTDISGFWHKAVSNQYTTVTYQTLAGNPTGPCGEGVSWVFDSASGTLTIYGSGAMKDYARDENRPWHTLPSDMTSLVVGDDVTRIGNYAFYEDPIGSVDLGNVSAIGFLAFAFNERLGAVVIPENLTTIEEGAFMGSGLSSVSFGANVDTIKESAFYYCTSLESVAIPEGVTVIYEDTFNGCSSLKSVTVPGTVQTIGNGAFKHCTALRSVEIEEGVKNIYSEAFRGCTSLRTVTIPESAVYVFDTAFEGCTALKTIVFKPTVYDVSCCGFGFFVGTTDNPVELTIYTDMEDADTVIQRDKKTDITFKSLVDYDPADFGDGNGGNDNTLIYVAIAAVVIIALLGVFFFMRMKKAGSA